jgi:DinB family protein
MLAASRSSRATVLSVTTCPECGYARACPPEQAVAVIGSFPDRLNRLLLDLGLRDDDRLRARQAGGVWSPLEYIAHTGDAIAWYAARINRVLNEDRPVLEPFDWDAHTAGQRYHERRLTDVLGTVRGTCAGLIAELGAVTAWGREGTGSDGSARTVAQLTDRAGHEAHHHLRDIELSATPLADLGLAVESRGLLEEPGRFGATDAQRDGL